MGGLDCSPIFLTLDIQFGYYQTFKREISNYEIIHRFFHREKETIILSIMVLGQYFFAHFEWKLKMAPCGSMEGLHAGFSYSTQLRNGN